MAGQKRDAKWLKEQLSRVLDWDEMILDVLVDHVVHAAAPGADRSELDEMVQNFMADSPAGIALINDFLAPPSPAAAAAVAAAARGTASAAAAATGGAAGGGGGGKTYAASASSSQPSAGAGGRQAHQQAHQQHHQQQRQQPQQRQQQQQQQQHPQQMRSAGAAAAAQAGAAPTGWQALSGPGAASKASAAAAAGSSTAAVAVAADEDDDFSRFVVDDRSGGAGGKGGAGSRSKPGSSRDLQALDAAAAGAEKPGGAAAGDSGGGGGKVLGMFKAGGRIKAPTAKPVGVRGPDGGALALAASLERQVLNCLGCGKIYDCRSVTNDVLRFLDKGGVCTFCGDAVPLSYKDRQKAAAAAADAAEAAAAVAAVAAAGGAEDAATAAARAFKDRLVEYDRNAAKRTTVIDDQSDFFEIDTNAWLTDQEREELRRRRRLEEEAEAARRKRLTVTIDLIGRKVVLDEDVRKAEEAAAAAAAERAAAAAKAAAAAEALRNTDGDGGGAYGGGVAFSGNALSGSGAPGGPTQEQLAAALDSLRRMKASLNPAVAANAAPLFLPTTAAVGGGGGGAAAAGGASGGGGGGGSRRFGPAGASTAAAVAPTAAAGSCRGGGAGPGGAKGGAKGGGRPMGQTPRRHERVQHDLGAEYGFDAFGAEVALDELMGGALLAAAAEDQQDGPYDICPPDMAPSTSYSGAAKAPSQRPAGAGPRAVPGLPPGVVVLKGYLTMDEQIRIVREIRELGIGPGGFYVPSYNTGARLNLRMMCLGLHWEPRTSKYETIRSSYDGATPPPLPPGLAELCSRCLAAASAAAVAAGGSRFPALKPDICLANFYERSGRLGMHQDKDEMSDSLRAGLPVVSLSLGDAADFLYGSSRDVDEAGSVRLESGDLLVFGGPGRMIFHSVAKVHPNTAPQELIRATGMRPGRLNLTFRQYRAV